MELPPLSLLKLDFRLQVEEAIILPPFLGSTLRGAFGSALKHAVYLVPHESTENCWLREVCAYQYIFESKNLGVIPNEDLHAQLRGQKEFPHPFVLIPPNLTRKSKSDSFDPNNDRRDFNDNYQSNHFARGETLSFSILLIGETAANHWTQVLVAVRLLAENGMGNSRIPFTLMEAFAHDAAGKTVSVYNRENGRVSARGVSTATLSQMTQARVQALTDQTNSEAHENFVRINFVSPGAGRLLLSGKNKIELRFCDLIKKITERCEHLASLYAKPSQKIDYRSILPSAENVRIIENSLQSYRYEQHSNRQQRHIPRDIFLGEISYQGREIKDFLPFLAAGEILHVGAGSSSGLGRFVLQT